LLIEAVDEIFHGGGGFCAQYFFGGGTEAGANLAGGCGDHVG